MHIKLVDHRGDAHPVDASAFAAQCCDHAFVKFFDGAAVKVDDEMTPLDWAVSTLLQAPIRRYDPLAQLVANDNALWKACNQALKDLGKDLPLESDAAESKRDAVENCFAAFMRPTGIGPSIASKTLHKKRPELLPVADDYVVRFLVDRDTDALTAGRITDVIFKQFRPLLLDNLQALEDARKDLSRSGLKLSNARLLDIAIWSHVDQHKGNYGVMLKKSDKAKS